MPLDPRQRARAEAWLNRHLPAKPCPICSQSPWPIHDAVNGLTDITAGALPAAGHVTMYGVVLFRGGGCGYVVPVAAHPLGIDVAPRA